jgi:hypothetical protein
MNLKDLTKEIEYKWREGPGGKKLAYIDARDVQNRLDEVVGAENWQVDYKVVGNLFMAGIGIRVPTETPDKNYFEWVWKWDTGTESNIEVDKGLVSDAFKRAAVQWGVGRFLYDIKSESAYNQPAKVFTGDAPKPRIIDNEMLQNLESKITGDDPTMRQRDAMAGIVRTNPDLMDEYETIETRKQASDFIGKYGYKK